MDIKFFSVQLKTASPLHHGYAQPISYNEGHAVYRAVRQIKLMKSNVDNTTVSAVSVPVLGGNALRGRLRRHMAYETLQLLGIDLRNLSQTPISKLAFHTLTSGGALMAKEKGGENKKSSPWTQYPAYRNHRAEEWPLLSLMGFSMSDFMIPSKLRISFGWPLVHEIQDIVSIPEDEQFQLFPGQWAAIDPKDLMQGSPFHPEDFHMEYKHADDHVMTMPNAGAGSDRDTERAAMIMAMQYVPVGVPFGVRLTALDLSPLESSVLRLGLESAFPNHQRIVFGGHVSTGMGLMDVVNQSGFHQLEDPEVYRDYIQSHRDQLMAQLSKNALFFTNSKDLKNFTGAKNE